MLEFHSRKEPFCVFPAENHLTEQQRVIQVDPDGRADLDRTLQFETDPAHGNVLDARWELDLRFAECGDSNGLIGLDARFAPLVHDQHIGR
jgi:hypothetical protein